jgi:hypothetical protein
MNAPPEFQVKKLFLHSLIVSVVASAVLGTLALLSGNWGWLGLRVFLTAVTVSGASICGLASGAYLASRRGLVLPLAGIALSLLGAIMLIAGMWLEFFDSAVYWQVTVSVSVFAVAFGHLSLLSMARLAQWFQWSLMMAHVVILSVASIIVAIIWAGIPGAGVFQMLGVATIIDAAITVLCRSFTGSAREKWLPRTRCQTEWLRSPTTLRSRA